jgi:hypothetical protein
VSSAQQPAGPADRAGQPPPGETGQPPPAELGQPPAAGAGQPPPAELGQPPAAGVGQVRPAGIPAQASPSRVPAQTRTARPGGVRAKPDLYRSPVAPLVWWIWAAFALANLIDLAVQGRDHFALVVAAILILVTGVAYVAAFRPRVLADDAGITIRNPLRDHHVPWGCVQDVELRDSLEVRCTPQDGEQRAKTLYAWAVHSSRRGRIKAEARMRRSAKSTQQPPSYGRLPAEARAALTKTDSENIAVALGERATRARAAGATGGRRTAVWDLPAIAALVLPALLLLVVLLV